MNKKPSFRDLTKLSAYLDGELSASAARKMKNRLARDPELATALDDLRETKSILQRIPKRPSPRNFTLSPQMVAKSPPMPRLVPALNYATAIAMILFFFSILPPFGYGAEMAMAPEMLMETPALAEAPAMEAFAADEEALPSTSRAADDSIEKSTTAENALGVEETISPTAALTAPASIDEAPEMLDHPSFTLWQEILLAAIILFATAGFILRRALMLKWQKRNPKK